MEVGEYNEAFVLCKSINWNRIMLAVKCTPIRPSSYIIQNTEVCQIKTGWWVVWNTILVLIVLGALYNSQLLIKIYWLIKKYLEKITVQFKEAFPFKEHVADKKRRLFNW